MTIDRVSGPASEEEAARLTAQITANQPTLMNALRTSSARICKYAGLLEAELKHFRPLEGYLVDAVTHTERRSRQPISDELYNRLAERLGVSEVRIALQRVADAHPDAPGESGSDAI
ncbi:MAG TPA: hypothetical protein VFA45_01465 [Actinomycetes bacterium]|jgi:hypothetical protein|nr:hypothetical protein [Actinomycetes bacterium]